MRLLRQLFGGAGSSPPELPPPHRRVPTDVFVAPPKDRSSALPDERVVVITGYEIFQGRGLWVYLYKGSAPFSTFPVAELAFRPEGYYPMSDVGIYPAGAAWPAEGEVSWDLPMESFGPIMEVLRSNEQAPVLTVFTQYTPMGAELRGRSTTVAI